MMQEPPTPDTIAQQINPQFLNDAALLADPHVFDAAAVATFAKPRALREIFLNYAPTLDNALDKMGRSLLLLYTQTRDIREKIGDEAQRDLEEKIRNTFKGLGESLILIQQSGEQLQKAGT
jgi:hypothetical protein